MKKKLKINFGYFWDHFDKNDNFFSNLLSEKYEVEISDDPEFFFFTHSYNGKNDYLNFNCHRIFLGWENVRADWNICDYVLDSDFYNNNPKHKRFPIWASWNLRNLLLPKDLSCFKTKQKFCCMVVSNGKAKERIDFFNKLSKYKKVDSGGRYLNNIDYVVGDKMEFIKNYKFVISFENSSYPGYTTEKLIEPMMVNSIPIYWGNPVLNKDFNTKSFINIHDFETYDKAIEHIIALDTDSNLYMNLAAKPWFESNLISSEFSKESLIDFFDYIINDSINCTPVAKIRYKRMMHKLYQITCNLKFLIYKYLKIQNGFR